MKIRDVLTPAAVSTAVTTALAAALTAGAVLLPATPSLAQAPCLPRDALLRQLDHRFDEVPVARGLAQGGTVVEITANAAGGWTLLVSHPNGLSCPLASGEAWRALPDPAPASPAGPTAPGLAS